MEELFQHAKAILAEVGFFQWNDASVVMTGGGAQLQGSAYLATQFFGVPARVGGPGKLPGLPQAFTRPEYSTAVGLAQYAAKHTAIEISTTGSEDPLRAFYEQVVEMVKRRIARTE
jgi:cell division protein FtsA